MKICATSLLFALLAAAAAAAQGAGADTQRRALDPLTAMISGRVTSADTGSPLRRAEVRATSERGVSRLATTDSEGRYIVRDLPAGNFTLHVSKTGFVPLYFGQRRPFERRTTIPLKEGERFGANVALRRAGAITGRIVDRAGEPVMGARVQVLRRTIAQGQPGLQPVGVADVTDDTGAYRVYALPAGDYYVLVTPRNIARSSRPGQEAPARTIPIFYPGTANQDEAQRITVDVAGEARADLQLVDVRPFSVSGVVLTSSGSPASGAMLTLMSLNPATRAMAPAELSALLALQLRDDAAADGSFTIGGVPPGSYTLSVQTRMATPVFINPATLRTGGNLATSMEAASVPITVDGDMAGVTVTTAPGGTLDVEFARAEGVTRTLPSSARVAVRMTDGSSEMGTMGIGTGGKISVVLARPARLEVEGLPEEWTVKAILLDNQDVTDTTIHVKNGNATARIVLTDRVTEVSGSVAPASSASTGPLPPAMVIAFADDDKKWTFPSRYIRATRTNPDGSFRMLGLPADETYRFVAVDYLEDGEETDAAFLTRLRDRAVRLPLGEGERRSIDLRLIQR